MKSFLFILATFLYTVASLDNGLGRTPAMGWNSWNKFACHINETLIKSTADTLVSSGLRDLGYVYLNLDDCWQLTRDNDTGRIQPDPKTFPSGMKALGEYIHGKGLKYGLYSSSGTLTCQRRPGGLFYEDIDAQTYAEWEVDYIKYDNCFNLDLPSKFRYPLLRDALNKTGRPIYYSLCQWGHEEPWTWASEVGNSWRTTGDISNNWESVLDILDQQARFANASAPGGWNDPDMLEVGNGNLTIAEEESHFSLWALMKSPLIIGCDINVMTNETFRILSNTEIIAVNQDPLGRSALPLRREGDEQIWGGPVVDGFVVAFLNTGDKEREIEATFSLLGLTGKQNVRDLWVHADLGVATEKISAIVPSHGVKVFKFTAAKGETISA